MSPPRLAVAAPAIERALPTLAFYSHVEADVRAAARRAGVGLVVPRSRMAREGASLVAADARGPRSYGERPELKRVVEHRARRRAGARRSRTAPPSAAHARSTGARAGRSDHRPAAGTPAARRASCADDERRVRARDEPFERRALPTAGSREHRLVARGRARGRPPCARLRIAMQLGGGRAENQLGIRRRAVVARRGRRGSPGLVRLSVTPSSFQNAVAAATRPASRSATAS